MNLITDREKALKKWMEEYAKMHDEIHFNHNTQTNSHIIMTLI